MTHSPEPWQTDDWLGIADANCSPVANHIRVGPDDDAELRGLEPDNIMRIIACVNAFKGIPTEVIESLSEPVIIDNQRGLLVQFTRTPLKS